MKMLHKNALRRRKQTVTAVALVTCLRPKRQMHRLLVRHRGTPPNAFARDSWLVAGFLACGLSPSTTFPETYWAPVVLLIVGYPLTVAGAAAELPAETDAPHSLEESLQTLPVTKVTSGDLPVNIRANFKEARAKIVVRCGCFALQSPGS